MEVTKWLKPSISVSQIGDSASVQAATRVNAEQTSKRTMRRSTRQPYRGRLIRLDEMSEAIRSDAAFPRQIVPRRENHESSLQGIPLRIPVFRQIRLRLHSVSRFQINDLGILHGGLNKH